MGDRFYDAKTNSWQDKPTGTAQQRAAWEQNGNPNWSPFAGFNTQTGTHGGGNAGSDPFNNPMFPGQSSQTNPLDPFGIGGQQVPAGQGDPTTDLGAATAPLDVLAPGTAPQTAPQDTMDGAPAPVQQAPQQAPQTAPKTNSLFGTVFSQEDAQQSKTGLGKMADIMDPIWSITSPQYLEKKRQAQSQQVALARQQIGLDQDIKKAALNDYNMQREIQARELTKRAAQGDVSALNTLRTQFPEAYEAAKPRLITSLRDNRAGLNDLASRLETATSPQEIENIKQHIARTDPDLGQAIEGMSVEELKQNAPLFREMANDVQAQHIAQQKRTNALNGYTPLTNDKGVPQREDVTLSNGMTVSLPLMQDAYGNTVYDTRMLDKKGIQWATEEQVASLRKEYTKEWERGAVVNAAYENVTNTYNNWERLGTTRGPVFTFSFVKALDAESVVREAEVYMVQSERDVMSTFRGNLQRIKEGGHLTKEEAAIFVDQIAILKRAEDKRLAVAREQAMLQAAGFNIKDPKRVIRGYDEKTMGEEWAAAQASAQSALDDFRANNSMAITGPTDQAGNPLVGEGNYPGADPAPARTTGEAQPAPAEVSDPNTGRTIFDYTEQQEQAVAKRASDPKPVNPGDVIEFDLGGKIRNLPVSKEYLSSMTNVLQAVSQEMGQNVTAVIVSAGQEKGIYDKKGNLLNPDKHTGGPRHDVGPDGMSDTTDLVLKVDGQTVPPGQGGALYQSLFKHAAAAGHQGMGHYSWGVHIGSGSRAFWGPDTRSASASPYMKAGAAQGYAGDTSDMQAIQGLPPQRPGEAQAQAAAPLQQDTATSIPSDEVIDAGFIQQLAFAESTNRNIDHGGAPGSGPSGYFGFADGTWKEVTGLSGRAMDYPYEVQASAAAKWSNRLAATLEKQGHEINRVNIYALHFLGEAGGNRLLSAPDNQIATRHASKAAVKNNPNVFYRKNGKPRTVAEVKDEFARKMGGNGPTPPRGPGPGPRPDPRTQAPAGNNPLAPLQQAQAAGPQASAPAPVQADGIGAGATADQLQQFAPQAAAPAQQPQSPFAGGGGYGGIGAPTQADIDAAQQRRATTAELEEKYGANRYAAIEHGIRQGLTLGWADEMGLVPSEEYEILRKAYPATTLLSEIVGGVASGGAVTKGVQMGARGVSGAWNAALQALGIGAEGAATGAGFAEEGEKGQGAIIGALGSLGIVGVTGAATKGWQTLRRWQGGDLDQAVDLVIRANQGDEIAKKQAMNAGLSANDIKDAALQAQGVKLANAGDDAAKAISPGSASAASREAGKMAPVKRDAIGTGEAVAAGINAKAQVHRDAASKLYGQIKSLPIPPKDETATELTRAIQYQLSQSDMPILKGSDEGAHKAISMVSQNLDDMIGPNGFNFNLFDSVRSDIGGIARNLSQNGFKEQAAKVKAVQNAYDDVVLGRIDELVMQNGDTIGGNLKTARKEWALYRKLTDERSKDYVEKTIAKMASEDRTPEQVTNLLFGQQNIGAKDTSRAVAAKLKEVVGADSPAWQAVRGEALGRIFYDRTTGDLLPRDKLVANMKYFLGGQGKGVGEVLFTKQERANLAALGTQLVKRDPREKQIAIKSLAASLGANYMATRTMGPFMGPAVAESVTGKTPLRGFRELRMSLNVANVHNGTPLGDLSESLITNNVNWMAIAGFNQAAAPVVGRAMEGGGPAGQEREPINMDTQTLPPEEWLKQRGFTL